MSDTQTSGSAIDKLSADESALMDAMRNEVEVEAQAPEPEAAPAAAEAPIADDTDDAPESTDTPERSKTVPHQQFHAERERRKAAEAKAAAAEQKVAVELARAQERLNLLSQAVSAATTPVPVAQAAVEIPDAAIDPVGHFQALHEQTQRTVQEQQAILNGMQEQARQQQQVQELRQWGTQQEASFMEREPAYRAAMDFMTAQRHAELEAAGIADPQERFNVLNSDVTQIALRSRQEGVNFAERLYQIALKRGFAPTAAAPATPAAPALPPLDAEPSTAATRAQRGRDAATTIGTVGTAPPAQLSPEKIANMSESQFAALLAKTKGNPAALRDIMGH